MVVPAPGAGPGNWAGAASAVLVDGVYWLTYRVRRPLGEGRGVSVVVARSDDGVALRARSPRSAATTFGAESFERPVLVPPARRRLAALPLLRDPGVEALVDRGGRRRRARRPAEAARAPSCLPGHRRGGGQGPGRPRRRVRLADVGVLPPADRARARGPDDDRVRHQRRRARLGRGTASCWRRPPARWDQRGARVTAVLDARPARPCCTTGGRPPRTTGTRPPASPLERDGRSCVADRTNPVAARRTATARSATSPRCRCPTAARASTSRRPAPTARTTC